ncbi:SH3 and PX domain-containing protein 2A [Elysia marginata]|uniref:SH3 and PX domain-containing protein 2A n=1 Tax=Elysia marginata TaxID=1093978 RepID=A0AAV4HH66_9GAST|nr:SH3 and PX domain-containing protein 2A [Elysia marginata]
MSVGEQGAGSLFFLGIRHSEDEDRVCFHIKQPQTQEHAMVLAQNNHSSVLEVPERVTVKTIEVIGAREDQSSKRGALKSHREDSLGRRGCPEYEIHTTWSNGEVTQIFMKYKQFQDLHHRVLNKFPEEKEKKQRTIPPFPGNYSLRSEPLKSQIESLNSYLSQLTKTPPHILECDILHTALRNGPVIRCLPPQAPPQPAMKSSVLSSHSGLQTVNPVPEENHIYAISSKRGSVCDNPAIRTSSMCSTDLSQMSSNNNSPANSRTSSPAPNLQMGGKAPKGGTVNSLPVQQHHGSNIELSLNQLLCLLNLDNYSDNLKEFSFKQILSMSIEDYSKAGLPVDAQVKLRTKLDQLKLTSCHGRNGIVTKSSGLHPLPQNQSQLPTSAPVAEAAAAAYQYPYIPVSPSQFTYLGPPGSSFAHHPLPQVLPYTSLAPTAMGQHTAVLATPLIPPLSTSNNQQHQQAPLLPLASVTSQFPQDLLASPDFPNSAASSPPASPRLGQESEQQSGSSGTIVGSSSNSPEGSSGGQATPSQLPYVPSVSSHSIVAGSNNGGQGLLAPGPLPMMSPPAAIAADTLALSEVKQLKGISHQQMHSLEESVVGDEDIQTGYQDLGNPSKAKSVSQHSVPVAAGSVPMIGNALSGVGAGEEPVMIMSGGPTPLLSGEMLLRTDGNPTPPLPPTVLSVSSQNSAVLANGYMADPPVPLQPSAAVLGRALHTLHRGIGGLSGYKVTAQPTHTTPGLHTVTKIPGLDHPSLGAAGAKNGNTGTGPGVNGNNPGLIPHPTPVIPPHHHSYMPPPVAGPPHQSNNNGNNSNIITSSSGASNGNTQLISHPPPAPPSHADANYPLALYPMMYAAHAASQHHQQRGIVTSVAGSSVMNSTQSNQSGHSPSPRGGDVCGGGIYKPHAGEALPSEPPSSADQRGSPTSQTPPHQQVGSVKAQSHPSGQHSSTPSPPLVQSSGTVKASFLPVGNVIASSSMLAAGNEPGPVGMRGNTGGGQMLPYCLVLSAQNGIFQHIYAHHPHQQAGGHHSQPPPPPPTFPNGLGPGAHPHAHDPFMRPIAAAPQFTAGGQVPPNFYGNSVYPPPHLHNQHHFQHQHHQLPNNNCSSHQGRNTNSPAGANSSAASQLQGKAFCCNCGQPGHRAADCKESTMENMSNSYRLNFEPKADPQ